MAKRPRIFAFDFIRAVCAILIVIYHFSCDATDGYLFFNIGAGDTIMGSAAVTAFFMLSGASLYYNHPDGMPPLTFYRTRAKAIYPTFYITWLIWAPITLYLSGGHAFDGRNPWTFLLTIAGVDNYFFYVVKNYGLFEWFMGALIFVYALYPLIDLGFRKARIPFLIGLTLAFILTYRTSIIYPSGFCNIFACVFSLVLGMALVHYGLLEKKWFLISGSAAFLIFVNLPLSGFMDHNIQHHLVGGLLFVFLYAVGTLIHSDRLQKPFKFAASVSYESFLVQHLTISAILFYTQPISFRKKTAVLLFTIVAVILESYLIHLLVKLVVSIPGRIRAQKAKA